MNNSKQALNDGFSMFLDMDDIGTSSLIELIDVIIKTYMLNTYCIAIFSSSLEIQTNVVSLRFDNNNLSNSIFNAFERGCSDFIISTDDPARFLSAYDENIHATNQRRGNRKLVFLPKVSEDREKLIELCKSDILNYIPDVLFVLPDAEAFDLATHVFVGTSGNNDLVFLDTWHSVNRSFESGADLFPDKISNMMGRTINMATFSYKPYTLLDLDENDEIVGLDGTEMKAAIEFCKWLNCSIKIIRDDVHEWGEIWDNRTGNGILGNIVTDRADIGYGALYSWYHEYLFLDLTMPIVRTGITVIAPVPVLIPSWLLPILPFNKLMWSGIFVALIVGAVGIFITGRMAKNPFTIIDSTLSTIGIFLAQVPSLRNPPKFLRYVLSLLVLLGLILSSLYSSGLSSAVTVPRYEEPVDTVQQLVDSNLDWGATHDAWIFSILLSTEPNIVRLLEKFKKWPEQRLRSKGRTRDFAYSVERLPAGHYAIGEYVTESSVPYFRLMSEDIYWEQCVFMARKSSPYTRKINTFFSRLHQSGIPYAWETQVVLKHSNFKIQLAVRLSQGHNSEGAQPRPLTVEHFEGPIFLWIFGMVFAFVIFLGECLRKQIVRPKNPVPTRISRSILEEIQDDRYSFSRQI